MGQKAYWIAMQSALGYSSNMSAVMGYFKSPQAVIEATPSEWQRCPYLSDRQIMNLSTLDLYTAEKIENECKKNSWNIITPDSEIYPQELLRFSDFPCVLYVDGDCSAFDERFIAVSGTKNASEQGLLNAEAVTRTIYKNNALAVSGAAKGCDMSVLESALSYGKSIAITAWGLGGAPDAVSREYMKRVSRFGAVVTCYEPFAAANISSYLVRNKLMASLCDSMVAVEASEKSGTLKMAASFWKLHKTVYAVPGSAGCDMLLRKGALVWRGELNSVEPAYIQSSPHVQQIKKSNKTEINLDNLSQNAIIVYNILKAQAGVTDIDTVITESGLMPTQAACALTELELMGAIFAEARGYCAQGL